MEEKRKKVRTIKLLTIGLVVLLDIIIIPWLIKFLLIGIDFIKSTNTENYLIDSNSIFKEWLDYGVIQSIKDIFLDYKFRNIFLVIQLILITAIVTFYIKDKLSNQTELKVAGSGQHGTARWQTSKEKDQVDVWSNKEKITKSSIIFGMEKNKNNIEKIWGSYDDLHTLLIGATGSGKSRKVILPSIWALGKAGESMILGDPKGELYISSKDYLEKEGYNVISLNLREPLKGNQWNMLDLVNKTFDEGDVSKATEMVWDIASAITKQKPSVSSEPIWQNGEESVIAALILLTLTNSEFKFQRTMTTVYYLLAELGQPLYNDRIPLIDYIKKLPTRHPAKAAFATASLAPYKTRASFFTQATSDLRLFSDVNISDMTSKQDHDIEQIGIKKTAVFLIVPDEKSTRNILATLYIDQVYQALVDLAIKRGGRIPRRVNIIIDEFGNFPAIPMFSSKLTVGRGRGIRFTIAVQDIAQIKELYKGNAQTIMGNCHNWMFLKTADTDTAKLISEKTGKYTVATENFSTSNQSRGNNVSTSHGTGLIGRPLLMPDEVLRWNSNYNLYLPIDSFPAKYPLPDLSLWQANSDFGFIKPTDNLEKDKKTNLEIIKKRWDNHKKRELGHINIWLPSVDEIYTNRKEETKIKETEKEEIKEDVKKENFL